MVYVCVYICVCVYIYIYIYIYIYQLLKVSCAFNALANSSDEFYIICETILPFASLCYSIREHFSIYVLFQLRN